MIELKVYHSKIRTESYSRYIMNLKPIAVEFGETNNMSEDELEIPWEQLGSADHADPLWSCLLSLPPFAEISFSTSLAKMDPKS